MRGFLTTLLLLVASHVASYGAEGALLHCDNMTHEFGVVDRRGGDIVPTFTIENRGDTPLIIKRVVRSCSCLKVSLSRRPIETGGSREMRVTYELRKMPPGLFSKVVQIYSSSRDEGFSQFTITGRSSNLKLLKQEQ